MPVQERTEDGNNFTSTSSPLLIRREARFGRFLADFYVIPALRISSTCSRRSRHWPAASIATQMAWVPTRA